MTILDRMRSFHALARGAGLIALLALTISAPVYANLYGIDYSDSISQNRFLEINTTTAQTTVLNHFSFDSGFWMPNTFFTDQTTTSAYAVSSDNTLYRFDLTTGGIISTTRLDTTLQALDSVNITP